MHKNELLVVLRSFTRSELLSFKKFLNSDYFGRKTKPYELLQVLLKYHPMYYHVNLHREKLYRLLYPGKKYNGSTLRNLFNDLHEAALHFLAIKNFEGTVREQDFFLFNELMKKGLHNEFTRIIEKIEEEKDNGVDWVYFLSRHFRESNKFNFSHNTSKMKKHKNLSSEIDHLNSSINNLIYFFVMNLASIYLNFLFYKNSFNTAKLPENISKSISLIDFGKMKGVLAGDKNVFILDIYEAMLETYSSPGDISKYMRYKQLLADNFRKLSPDEICMHYYKMITYCLYGLQNKSAEFGYDTELKSLYTEFLENSYYLDRNTPHLPHELYRNILLFSARIKDYKWMGNFVDNYSFKVFPGDRENMFHFGNAYLCFYTGKYLMALEHVNNIDLDFFIYKVDTKNLTLMIYYELGYIEGSFDMLSSYREFICKNKLLNTEKKKRYMSFSKFFEKLLQYRSGTLRHDPGYIRHCLMNNTLVAYKSWLMEKMNVPVIASKIPA